jgi:transposase
MSLKPTPLGPIPDDTLAVGRALLAEDDLYRRIGEQYATLLRDEEFADLYSSVGKPAISPALLALVLVLQATEFISDRVALHMLRTRIDWKYALHLPLNDQGFDASVLSEFRARLARSHAHRRVFDAFLRRFREMGLLKGRSTQRTDATMILAAVRDLTRTELIFETVRKALEEAARRAPEWTRANVDPEWIIRYGEMQSGERVIRSWGPRAKGELEAALRRAGAEAKTLLTLMTGPGASAGLANSDEVKLLARVWGEQFHEVDGQVEPIAWNKRDGASARIATPHDPQARFRTKGSRSCVGYGLHVTETADEQGPAIIVDVAVEPIGRGDTQVLPGIQQRLEQRGLRPERQLVDGGYTSGKTLADSRAAGTELIGPVRRDQRAGTESEQEETRRFGGSDFALDFERRVGVCPAGKRCSAWYELARISHQP